MSFVIHIHPKAQILEVVYPASPSVGDMTAYIFDVKNRIDGMGPRWSCLVDQRVAGELPDRMKDKVALMTTYAVQRGMSRCARVVSNIQGEADTRALIAMTKITIPVRVFTSREEAVAWLSDRDSLSIPPPSSIPPPFSQV